MQIKRPNTWNHLPQRLRLQRERGLKDKLKTKPPILCRGRFSYRVCRELNPAAVFIQVDLSFDRTCLHETTGGAAVKSEPIEMAERMVAKWSKVQCTQNHVNYTKVALGSMLT